ncbi:MAG: arsenate reductase ArsC [Gammaproteobacteria bacterium]
MNFLFACTHNACRSILAEVIGRELGKGRMETASAGSSPSGRVHPLALRHLALHGYGTQGLASKGFPDVQTFKPDVVITLCDRAAEESCPVWLGNAARAHWGLPDPSHLEGPDEDRSAAFGAVIATLESRITRLLQSPFESLDSGQLTSLLQEIAEQE